MKPLSMNELIVRRYLRLLKEQSKVIELILAGDGDHNESEPILPLLLAPCVFRGTGRGSDSLEMLAAPGERSQGLKEIRDFTAETVNLIVIDPYIFSGPTASAECIADDFLASSRAKKGTLKRVHFVHEGSKVTKSVKSRMVKALRECGVTVTHAETDTLHDRLWISNRSRGLVVGHSLNGIGGKASFLLHLPESDLVSILAFLDTQKLIGRQS